MDVDASALLLSAGALLLGIAAFMGFAQARTQRGSAAEAKWRVVHSGGTAGGVQLLALAAVWPRLASPPSLALAVALALVVSTWLFFVGPLLKAISRVRTGNALLLFGAVAAVPAYGGLIVLAIA